MNTLPRTVSYVIPCLNEAESIGKCVRRAKEVLEQNNIQGEVIVADNGSDDDSVALAQRAGARVVHASISGYGEALKAGFQAAQTTYIFMADADMSYDFADMPRFLACAESTGASFVIGCRFHNGGGKVLPGAMPWYRQYIGNPVLSGLGRLLYRSKVKDFHCGARLFNKDILHILNATSSGMEFASEMIIKAHIHNISIEQVPIVLHPDNRKKTSHLRPVRDGLRHVRTLLKYWPKFLRKRL